MACIERTARAGIVVLLLIGVRTSASANDVARDRAQDLLGPTYMGSWVCKWEPDELGLRVNVTREPSAHATIFTLAFENGNSEREVYRFDPVHRSWLVTGKYTIVSNKSSYTYRLHDVPNPSDDDVGLIFEGSSTSFEGGRRIPGSVAIREVLYLDDGEWYHWRFAGLNGDWRTMGRRACGRTAAPQI